MQCTPVVRLQAFAGRPLFDSCRPIATPLVSYLTLAPGGLNQAEPPSYCRRSVMERRSSNAAGQKRDQEWIEETLESVHTNIENSNLAALSREHREYLEQRHGTLDLDPIPDANDADPYNWPQSRVRGARIPSPKRPALLTTL